MKSSLSRSAFTLLEILVALTIMVLILGAVWGAYAAATNSINRLDARNALLHDARSLLRRMARELRCSYPGNPGLSEKDRARKTTTTKEEVAVKDKPAFFLGSDRASNDAVLSFVTTEELTGGESLSLGIRPVAYRFDESSGKLFRLQRRIVDLGEDIDDDAPWMLVAEGIEDLKIEYHDGEDWQDEWDSNEKGGLPYAVKIAVTLHGQNGNPKTFITATDIVCRWKELGEVTLETTLEGKKTSRELPSRARNPRRQSASRSQSEKR